MKPEVQTEAEKIEVRLLPARRSRNANQRIVPAAATLADSAQAQRHKRRVTATGLNSGKDSNPERILSLSPALDRRGKRGGGPTLAILVTAPQPGFARPSLATPAPLGRFSSLTWGQDRPEPKEADPERRVAVVAVRPPAVARAAAPTAAPKHTVRARHGTTRISLRATRIRTPPPPIPAPLKHIPRHVI